MSPPALTSIIISDASRQLLRAVSLYCLPSTYCASLARFNVFQLRPYACLGVANTPTFYRGFVVIRMQGLSPVFSHESDSTNAIRNIGNVVDNIVAYRCHGFARIGLPPTAPTNIALSAYLPAHTDSRQRRLRKRLKRLVIGLIGRRHFIGGGEMPVNFLVCAPRNSNGEPGQQAELAFAFRPKTALFFVVVGLR